jgi:hypothetical protein
MKMQLRSLYLVVLLLPVFLAYTSTAQATSKYYKGDRYQFIGQLEGDKLFLFGVHESNNNLVVIEGVSKDGKLNGNWWGMIDGRAKTGGKIIFSESGTSLVKIYSKNTAPVSNLKLLAGSVWNDFETAAVSSHGSLGGSWQSDSGDLLHVLDVGGRLHVANCEVGNQIIALSSGCDETLTSFKCALQKVYGSAELNHNNIELARTASRIHEKVSNQHFNKKTATSNPISDPDEPTSSDSEDEGTDPEGPSSFSTSLSENFRFDYESLSTQDLSSISLDIFKDANSESGHFYYIPNQFALKWSESSGFGIQVNYLGASSGEAIISAELSHGISQLEEELIRTLLEKQVTKSDPFAQLQALPYTSAKLEIPALSLYGVSSSDISISIPHSSFASIHISWKMSKVDDFLAALFSGVGLSGNLVLNSTGPLGSVNIPVNLKIDDPATFGKISLSQQNWRGDRWRNPFPYPVVVDAFHLFVDESSESQPLYRIYTWEAGDVEIPKGGAARFDSEKVPSWIDSYGKLKDIWLSYSIPSCDYCKSGIVQEIVGGTTGRRDRAIEIESINPIEFTGAKFIDVRLRSLQADPNGLIKKELETVRVESDFEVVTGGALYPPDGESPRFEYFLKIYMEDGRNYSSDRWIEVEDHRLVIGTYQIGQSVSTFPK